LYMPWPILPIPALAPMDPKQRSSHQKEMEEKILEQLVKECPFPLPKSLLDRERRREEQQFRLRCQLLGMKPEETEEAFQKEKAQCEERAERGLRQALILDRVAALEKIEALPEEIEKRVEELSEQLRRRNGKGFSEDPSQQEALRARVGEEIQMEKAVAFLVTHAELREE